MGNYVENGYVTAGYVEGSDVIIPVDRGSVDAFNYGNNDDLPDINTPMVVDVNRNKILVNESGEFSINNHSLNVDEVIRILCGIDSNSHDDNANVSMISNVFNPDEIAIILEKYSEVPILKPTPQIIYENTSIDIVIDNYNSNGNYEIYSNVGSCVKLPGNDYFTFTPSKINYDTSGIITIGVTDLNKLPSLKYNRAISIKNNNNVYDSLLFNNDYESNELSNDGFTYL